jgi:3-oxoadipate CoA-transferase alpha subunit
MIDKIVTSLDEALAGIADGASILVNGFQGAGSPSRLLQALVEIGPRELTVIANGAGQTGSALAQLMASGLVRKLVCSSARGRGRKPSPFEEGWKAGRIELEIVPQGTFAERIRAGGAGIGGFYSPVGVGTKVAEDKEVRRIDGRDYILELPLKADVALIKGDRADRWGNVSYRLAQRNFGAVMASAADLTVFEVREIVPLGAIAPEAIQTPGIFVDRVLATGDML